MPVVIDGDSHFIEPLNLFEQYIDPAFRGREMRVEKDATTGELVMLTDGQPLQLVDVDELLAAVVGYGQKEVGRDLSTFDRYLVTNSQWQDMDGRIRFLDAEGIDQFAGDERFFVGSDYPHAEGFVQPIQKARELLSALPAPSIEKILGQNAQRFFGI